MLSSWLNVLLVFVPVGLGLFLSNASPILVFVFNGIAIIPLSALLTGATEKIASDAGDTIGAFLNISLGNLVELILFVALKHNQIHVVQASILGSMLVNLLPILGTALCVNGLWHDDPVLNTTETQLLSCLLFVSVFVFLIPTAFYHTFNDTEDAGGAILKMSRASALMVLLIYILYFVHEFRTHSANRSYHAASTHSFDLESLPTSPTIAPQHARQQVQEAVPPNRTIRFADEGTPKKSQDAPDTTGYSSQLDGNETSESESDDDKPEERRGRETWKPRNGFDRPSSQHSLARTHSRSLSLSGSSRWITLSRDGSSAGIEHRRLVRSGLANLQALRSSRASLETVGVDQVQPSKSIMERLIPVMILIISSGLMSMCAEFLVSTIDEVTHQGHLSESVIGLIILPIVGNVAEYVTVVTVASREKLDLAIAVAVGSSIQIALCVAPLTVIAGWILSRDLSLSFTLFEVAALMGTALLVNLLILSDGNSVLRTSGLKGGLMCACYVIIGFGAYLSPELDA
ncbi:Vacuolar calcium ion transporter [Colletotrichum sp. SAR 10_86]|nr:Vacuolar calcium ion transporter [Colletotrichum sp. SAR 10_75]KAI8233733.1 Vacuolar calcium ion transporter [Colletotrichum sp. SAR 10_86]KAJ5001574.1 Vacuolar calcium ion transporter [Colletotrichum sp. SAR 10_66]